jgi:endoglucanase
MDKTERTFGAGLTAEGANLAFYKVIIACALLCVVTPLYAIPLRLHVDGNEVKDSNGNILILRGVALTDLGALEDWKGGALNAVDRITNPNDTQGNSPGWYTKIIRIVIIPPDSTTPAGSRPHPFNADNNDLYNLLRTVVNYCAEKEVYVAIDWHYVAHTYDHVASTSEFWRYMAPRFKDDTHVIFELFNEPNNPGDSDAAMWTSVKNDMQTWIDIVRGYAPDNLIFVGTPSYCQIIGPTATDPVSDVNVVYISHIYPLHWLSSSHSYYVSTITAAAAAHPVIMGEWGFTSDMNYDDPYHIVIGTRTNYGEPLKEFVEGIGIGSIAWCAGDLSWGSPMFYSNNTLRVGEGEMGGFAKDWLFEASGVEQTIDLTINRCKVNAGKTQGQDVFEASGTMASSPIGLSMVTQIDVNIVSLADGNTIYPESIAFDAGTDVVKNKYNYSHKIPKGQAGAIASLKMDFTKKTFEIKTKNIDLTGLACPLQLNITIGNYTLSGNASESVVNGKKTLIPTRLMRTYDDTLVANKAKAKHNSVKASSDTLSVTGDIAVIDTDVNLCNEDVNFVWGAQVFRVPQGRFSASKTGHLYKCSKVVADINDGNTGFVTAQVDTDKATFTVSINGANAINTSGSIPFGISFADFNETVPVNSVTGRSW